MISRYFPRCRPFVFALLAGSCIAHAASAESILFKCPDLANKEKQTIAEMTQGFDGFFFRISGDMRQDYAIMPEAQEYFERMAKALANRGTQLVFISVPSRGIAGQAFLDKSQLPQKEFDAKATENSYLDMLDRIRKVGVQIPSLVDISHDEPGTSEPYFFKRDHHWTSWGAQKSAQVIAEMIKKHPNYKKVKPLEYETSVTSEAQMKHTMAEEIQRLCTDEIPAEPFPVSTTRLNASTGEDALFGDSGGGVDSSVLVGSSFSATENFNFDGFLADATGLEIANYAISAGLLFNSIVSYTSSPDFVKTHPPFLFWEAPGIYDLNKDTSKFFRQIIPAIHGDCGEGKAVASGKLQIENGRGGILLQADTARKIFGKNYYLFLESSSRALAKFTLELDYEDGDGEWFTVDRSEHFNNTGRFFVELIDEIESPLVKVTLEQPSNVNADVTARICKIES